MVTLWNFNGIYRETMAIWKSTSGFAANQQIQSKIGIFHRNNIGIDRWFMIGSRPGKLTFTVLAT